LKIRPDAGQRPGGENTVDVGERGPAGATVDGPPEAVGRKRILVAAALIAESLIVESPAVAGDLGCAGSKTVLPFVFSYAATAFICFNNFVREWLRI
jgi:hypothetical protein